MAGNTFQLTPMQRSLMLVALGYDINQVQNGGAGGGTNIGDLVALTRRASQAEGPYPMNASDCTIAYGAIQRAARAFGTIDQGWGKTFTDLAGLIESRANGIGVNLGSSGKASGPGSQAEIEGVLEYSPHSA